MAGLESGESPIFNVLKNGLTIGPMTKGELRLGLAEGRFERTDLVHLEGQEEWQPLERHFETEPPQKLTEGGVPDWKSILKWVWVRLRHDLTERGKIAAPVCVGLGILFFFLSRWPILLWLPWFLGAAIAGAVLIRRKHVPFGVVVLVAAAGVPLGLHHFVAKLSTENPSRIVASVSAKNSASPAEQPPAISNSPAVPVQIAGLPIAPEAPARLAALPTPAPAPPVAPNATPIAVTAHYARVMETPTPAPPKTASAPKAAPGEAKSDSFFASAGKVADTAISFFKGAKFSDSNASASASPSAEPIPAATPTPDMVESHKGSYIVVTGSNGSGSGFICRVRNRTWFFSNIHVMAELKQPVATKLDNTVVIPGQTEAAAGPDIVRSVLMNPPAAPLEAMMDLESNAHIGDEVVVLGNSGGGGVVTQLRGKILGIGPDRIEVNAEFIPGNSGSPIIHVKSGKVIGIATYLTMRYEEFTSQSGGTAPVPGAKLGKVVVRRFGYRIDNVPAWEPVNWIAIRNEADQMEAVSSLTEDLYTMIKSLRRGATPTFTNAALRRPMMDWTSKMENSRLNKRDKDSATLSFLNALRFIVRGDVADADARFRYTYFRHKLHDEQVVRDKMYKIFDQELARRPSGLDTPSL